MIDVSLIPGQGHDFHRHAKQEEVIVIMSGSVEQWIEREKRVLKAGDAVYIDANVVHASFNIGNSEANLIAILGPCVGEGGYESEEVAAEEPWRSLRSAGK